MRELTGNWDLSRVKVNSDETCELASAVFIITRNQFFVVAQSYTWDKWRAERGWILIGHFSFLTTPLTNP